MTCYHKLEVIWIILINNRTAFKIDINAYIDQKSGWIVENFYYNIISSESQEEYCQKNKFNSVNKIVLDFIFR